MAALSDYLENKIIDQLFRGQAYSFPTTLYVGLLTAAPTDSTPGTEVSGGSYARVAVANSLANWAGTQGAGTTTASSGTSGTTSNNNSIAFPVATANWGTVAYVGIYDAATNGNRLAYSALDTPRAVLSGDPVLFAAGKLSFQIDN
jgi:hypothetical protein